MNTPLDLEFHREQGEQTIRIVQLERDLTEIKVKLDLVLKFVHETQGGYKSVWWLMSIASTLGAGIAFLVTYWKGLF